MGYNRFKLNLSIMYMSNTTQDLGEEIISKLKELREFIEEVVRRNINGKELSDSLNS